MGWGEKQTLMSGMSVSVLWGCLMEQHCVVQE